MNEDLQSVLTCTIVLASTSSVTDSIPFIFVFSLLPSFVTVVYKKAKYLIPSINKPFLMSPFCRAVWKIINTLTNNPMHDIVHNLIVSRMKRWMLACTDKELHKYDGLTLIFSPVIVSTSHSCPIVKAWTITLLPVVIVTLKLSPFCSISETLLMSLPFSIRSSGRPRTRVLSAFIHSSYLLV